MAAWSTQRHSLERSSRASGFQQCQSTYPFYIPLGQMNPKGLLMFILLSPKGVYTPYKVGWKPWKPRKRHEQGVCASTVRKNKSCAPPQRSRACQLRVWDRCSSSSRTWCMVPIWLWLKKNYQHGSHLGNWSQGKKPA